MVDTEANEEPGEPEGPLSSAQDRRLTPGEIQRLKDHGINPHVLKPNSRHDLFKDRKGNIIVKPKDSSGPGDETGLNINDLG